MSHARSTDTTKHKHYWHYPHSIWQGRKDSEVAVARYCKCGEKQIAFAADWRRVPPRYQDMRDQCNDEIVKLG